MDVLVVVMVCLVNACHCIGWMSNNGGVFVVENGVDDVSKSQVSAIWPKAIVKANDKNTTTMSQCSCYR